jgi:myo-inositol-1(or 4)-monophosphatase
MREEFERVGGGSVLNNSPYDLAAAALIAAEAGAVVTDAAGESYDARPLLGSAAEFQMSVAIAANRGLHEQLVNEIAKGLERLRALRGDANRAGSA